MTVTTTTNKQTHTGTGAQTVFAYTFRMLLTTDMDVYVNGVLQGSGYTVSINDSGVGGNVTFASAPALNAVILFVRNVNLTQETDLPIEGNMPETVLENAYDKLTMLAQQLNEGISRGLTLPITSSKSGLFYNEPTDTLVIPVWDNGDSRFEFQSVASVINNALPALGGGNVTGPGPSVTDYALALFNGTGGLTLRAVAAVGTSRQILRSQGAGQPPIFETLNVLLKSSNIESSLRALPTSGALSGTYVHFGNWTSAGALTFSNDTRIYLKGSFTLNHTMTGTAQSNGGTGGSNYAWGGGRGGGPGSGDGGHAVHGVLGTGGGAGGGCGGAGGRGGWNGTAGANQGGRVHGIMTAGGSGGGAGAGDLAGTNLGQAGGGGGPFLYLEVDGALALNETIASPGANGTVATTTGGAGGGGAGGVIVIRASGALVIATGKKVSCIGGNGGNENTNGRGGGGGGGGIIEITTGGAHTVPDTAAVHFVATAGTAGSGAPTTAPAAGSVGVTTINPSVVPISLF